MPIDLRSPLHSSTSMIADFLADNEPLVGGPCRKKGPLTDELAPVLWRRGSWNILLHRKGEARCQRNNEGLRKSSSWKRCAWCRAAARASRRSFETCGSPIALCI